MKILICYFSGTGNTKKITDKFIEHLSEHKVETDLCNIEQHTDGISTEGYDMLGIAYPVWAFNVPGIVLDFAKRLEKKETNIPAFILKTSGEPLSLNDISSSKLIKVLKARNFIVKNEFHYVMPYNIIFRHTDKMAYQMWTSAQKVIPLDCEELLNGTQTKTSYVPFGALISSILRIQEVGGHLFGKKYKVDNETCIHCNKCMNNCPVGNISLDEDGHYKFGKSCLMCMRCSFYCPTNAIDIGYLENWKVNGAYSFLEPDETEIDEHENFCKKAYIKYFAEIDKRANSTDENAETETIEEFDDPILAN